MKGYFGAKRAKRGIFHLRKIKVGIEAEFNQRLKNAKTLRILSLPIDRLAGYH